MVLEMKQLIFLNLDNNSNSRLKIILTSITEVKRKEKKNSRKIINWIFNKTSCAKKINEFEKIKKNLIFPSLDLRLNFFWNRNNDSNQ